MLGNELLGRQSALNAAHLPGLDRRRDPSNNRSISLYHHEPLKKRSILSIPLAISAFQKSRASTRGASLTPSGEVVLLQGWKLFAKVFTL